MNSLKTRIQHQAYRIVIWQIGGICLLSMAALIMTGKINALSILMGGFAYALPNLVFVWRVFRYAGAQEMIKFLVAFLIGEMLKLILCGILFLFIVKYLPVSLLSVLIGLAGAMVSFWFACIWQFSRHKPKQGLNPVSCKRSS